MSMTQHVIDELREIADKIDIEAGQSTRTGQMIRLEEQARRIRECADELGDD